VDPLSDRQKLAAFVSRLLAHGGVRAACNKQSAGRELVLTHASYFTTIVRICGRSEAARSLRNPR